MAHEGAAEIKERKLLRAQTHHTEISEQKCELKAIIFTAKSLDIE